MLTTEYWGLANSPSPAGNTYVVNFGISFIIVCRRTNRIQALLPFGGTRTLPWTWIINIIRFSRFFCVLYRYCKQTASSPLTYTYYVRIVAIVAFVLQLFALLSSLWLINQKKSTIFLHFLAYLPTALPAAYFCQLDRHYVSRIADYHVKGLRKCINKKYLSEFRRMCFLSLVCIAPRRW